MAVQHLLDAREKHLLHNRRGVSPHRTARQRPVDLHQDVTEELLAGQARQRGSTGVVPACTQVCLRHGQGRVREFCTRSKDAVVVGAAEKNRHTCGDNRGQAVGVHKRRYRVPYPKPSSRAVHRDLFISTAAAEDPVRHVLTIPRPCRARQMARRSCAGGLRLRAHSVSVSTDKQSPRSI